jgi:hypothetical protein
VYAAWIYSTERVAVRVFWPIIKLHVGYRWLALKLLLTFRSKRGADVAKQAWLDRLSPVGVNPFALRIIHSSWAGAWCYAVSLSCSI